MMIDNDTLKLLLWINDKWASNLHRSCAEYNGYLGTWSPNEKAKIHV